MKRGRKAEAFVLLEIMLAAAILGIALISLGVAVGRCVYGVSAARNVDGALDLAEECFTQWSLSAARNGEIQTGSVDGEKMIHHRKYVWRQTTEATDDPKVLKSTLSIRWVEGRGEKEKTFVRLTARSTQIAE